jgi:hypothetical protein
MTIEQSQPLQPHWKLRQALRFFGPFDLFTQQRLIDQCGVSDDEIQRSIRLKHIEHVGSAKINNQPTYKKGQNWNP